MPTSRRSDLPVIGVTTYRETARWGVWESVADLLHAPYADAVLAAGGVPVLLPPVSGDAAVAEAVVSRIDGLIISGGADVDPGRYGEDPHPRTVTWRQDRDAWETALLQAADAASLPTLGVCRGMQLMAVAAGGTLHQHTPELVGHENHNPGEDVFGATPVATAEGSRLRALVGDRFEVGLPSPPDGRLAPGLHGDRLGRRRLARGDGATGPSLLPRRAVAPRGRRGREPLRRARCRGHRGPPLTRSLTRSP